LEDMAEFGERHGWPIVIKASRGGYDGRGVWIAGSLEEAESVWNGAQQ
ncbi:MAG: ATP-grasp domain-containing protein, partial [Chloroflexia bacterium]|nr:ATP-grasp domain-containing protein [Chloroflexia bacterium]